MSRQYLSLIKAKVRGLGRVADTCWFDIDKNLTVFELSNGFDRAGFVEALQSLNPPYVIHDNDPFESYPNITRQGKYQKRVKRHKRTICLNIFVGTPELVKKLASITSHLYETDRIEVGRRFDLSRWINFVEIASSTRWSEVKEEIDNLLYLYPEEIPPSITNTTEKLLQTDRVKGELLQTLESFFFHYLRIAEDNTVTGKIEDMLFHIRRHSHFTEAKRYVSSILPVYRNLSGTRQPPRKNLDESNVKKELIEMIESSLTEDKEKRSNPSIFLLDESAFVLSDDSRKWLREKIAQLAEHHQCLYLTDGHGHDIGFHDARSLSVLTEKDLERDMR